MTADERAEEIRALTLRRGTLEGLEPLADALVDSGLPLEAVRPILVDFYGWIDLIGEREPDWSQVAAGMPSPVVAAVFACYERIAAERTAHMQRPVQEN